MALKGTGERIGSRRKATNALVAIGVVVVLLAVFRVLALSAGRVAGDFFYPFLNLPGKAYGAVSDHTLLLNNRFELARAVELLEQQNRQLLAENTRLQSVEAENARLRDLLNLQKPKGYQYIPCEVILRDPLYFQEHYTVNVGSADGIEQGAAAICAVNTEGGIELAFAGRVARVGKHTALVQTLFNPEVQLSVRLPAAGAVGFANVDRTQSFVSRTAVPLTYLPENIIYSRGERAVSTGYERHLPAGILLGTLSSIDMAPTPFGGRLYRQGTLAPAVDPGELQGLFLVVSPGGKPIELLQP